MFKAILFVVVGFIAISAGIFAYQQVELPPPEDRPPLPSFSLPDTKGIEYAVETWKNKVLVINFWATWCPPCREEIPAFMKMQTELGPKGLQFIGIAIEEAEPVIGFLQEVAVNYPMLIAGSEGFQLSAKLGNTLNVVPFSLVVDRSGRIVHTQMGVFQPSQVRKWVIPLL